MESELKKETLFIRKSGMIWDIKKSNKVQQFNKRYGSEQSENSRKDLCT